MPHLALAVLTVLSFGALAYSVVSAPPVARTILHVGAQNTAGAPSFAVHESVSQQVAGHTTVLDAVDEQVDVPHHALEATQQSSRELIIGSTVYVSTDSGKTWTRDSALSGRIDVPAAIASIRQPLTKLLGTAAHVHMNGAQQHFSFTTTEAALIQDLHLNVSVAAPSARVPVDATIHGEFLDGFTAHLVYGGQHLLISEHFTHIVSLPTLRAPAVKP